MAVTWLVALRMVVSAGGPAAESPSRPPIAKPLEFAATDGCVVDHGRLRLARAAGQGAAGAVVIEAEDARKQNIAAHGTVGPFAATDGDRVGISRSAGLGAYVAFSAGARWERAYCTIHATRPLRARLCYRVTGNRGQYRFVARLNDGPYRTTIAALVSRQSSSDG